MPATITTQDIEFPSADGMSVCRGTLWLPEGEEPRAVVQIVHGMVEHLGRYDELARAFAERSWAVAGIDLLGHGRTTPEPDQRGVYNPTLGFEHLIADQRTLLSLVRKSYPDVPHVLLGHSMGSFIVRCCMARFGDRLSGAVILGTGWMPRATIAANRTLLSSMARALGWNYRSLLVDRLGIGGYNKRFTEGGERPLGIEWLSRDIEHITESYSDPDVGFTFSLSGYYTIMSLMSEAENERYFNRIPYDLPILIESGSFDPVGNFGAGPRFLAERLKAAGLENVTLTMIDGARHELQHELGREELIASIADWIEEHALLD